MSTAPRFRKRFGTRVLLPGAMILAITGALSRLRAHVRRPKRGFQVPARPADGSLAGWDEGLAERICRIVRDAGVSPHQIELEVTEGVVLDQNEIVRGALQRLRQEGFRIALDDFGTGYSSLSYLREFEVDKIKIDKSFIHSLG